MTIREATPSDLGHILGCEARMFAADAWSDPPVESTLIEEEPVSHNLRGYVVASVAGDIADLQRIAVEPTARRQGIATALLGEACVRSRRLGAQRMLLEVRAENAGALAFYAGHGFVQIDVRRRYYRDGADALVLQKRLTKGCG